VIDGGWRCVFGPTADAGHKAMRFVFKLTGGAPKYVDRAQSESGLSLPGDSGG